ncbi:hypothetical protein [Streptomyces albidus (ex Kaewkla and Franco 2022)]|uniref:hypothetical protein n=1 Tax=Streptomyces albidus (ex Kaewkla and Franco 2022) TaxID=722709 RepID=UPI0015EEFFF8|nr:hypothetical protein [Streptomyces albidus (ex Kaewkla and Franco 2022)]
MKRLPPTAGAKTTKVVVPIVTAAVVAAGAWFYFSGEFDQWRAGSALDEACAGTLPAQDVRSFLDSDVARPAKSQYTSDRKVGRLTNCAVSAEGSSTSLLAEAHRGSKADDNAATIQHTSVTDPSVMAVPLGKRLPGAIIYDGAEAFASVELPCSGKEFESIIASVRTVGAGDSSDVFDKAGRTTFAQVSVGFAKKAAAKYGCKISTPPGSPLSPPAANPLPGSSPVKQAIGTCRPLAGLAAASKKLGLARVQEAPVGNTTTSEHCYLLDSRKKEVYRLTALYGHNADSVRARNAGRRLSQAGGSDPARNWVWAGAKCPSSDSRALFTLGRVSGTAAVSPGFKTDASYEKKALSAFAEESAKRHGCSDLRLPG